MPKHIERLAQTKKKEYNIKNIILSILRGIFREHYAGKIFYLMKNEIKFFYHHSNLYGFVILEATFLFEFKNEYDIINSEDL